MVFNLPVNTGLITAKHTLSKSIFQTILRQNFKFSPSKENGVNYKSYTLKIIRFIANTQQHFLDNDRDIKKTFQNVVYFSSRENTDSVHT